MTVDLLYPLVSSLIAILFVGYLISFVLRQSPGTERMTELSKSIQDGAKAFLKREYIYVFALVAVVAILIALAPRLTSKEITLGPWTSLAFIAGSLASAIAGYIGMSIATRANARTANAAMKSGLRGALSIAVSGGAVMGMSVAGIALLGLTIVLLFETQMRPEIINGYAMGASLVALFARSGGGIYTKGADMGADLVGKLEAGIPEDDPRNPAVIADNVGDNVGDVAGLGADLLESYVESIISCMAIAGAAGLITMQTLPLKIASVGIIASLFGVLYVKNFGKRDPQKSLMTGTYISAGLTILATAVLIHFHPQDTFFLVPGGPEYGKWGIFAAAVIGVLCGSAIGFVSEYYTSEKYKPVQHLAESCQMGPAITTTEGTALGMRSATIPVLLLAIAIIVTYKLCGVYGVGIAALGMLATTGMIVSVDSYGPIADNAGGIAQMADLPPEVRKITDNLDAVGNTTAAIGKGFAIGSAAFAALALLAAYLQLAEVEIVDLKQPRVIAGALIGGMLPFFFSSMLFRAVGTCAYKMIDEVRRQFREIPGLMEGKVMPDYTTCVDISTKAAIGGMVLPGIIAIVAPVAGGFLLGKDGLAGMLVGSLVVGVLVGIQFANSGGALDNAKKYIEEGHFGGKNSEAHKAAVIGDTVGDPLKDTVGPSINILIKLMAVIALVFAPLF